MADNGRATGGAGTGRPWTVVALAILLIVEAIVTAEHARRLLTDVVTAEETLGLAALGPLDQEVPAVVIESLVVVGLVVAAFAVLRRSQLALMFAVVVQIVVLLDVVLRLLAGLPVVPTVALLVLAACIGALALAPTTRRWCDSPVWA